MFKPTSHDTQIKTTMRFHFTLVKIAVIKNKQNQEMLARLWTNGTFIHCPWDWISRLYGNQWRFLQKLTTDLPYGSAIPLLGFYLKIPVSQSHLHISGVFSIIYMLLLQLSWTSTGGQQQRNAYDRLTQWDSYTFSPERVCMFVHTCAWGGQRPAFSSLVLSYHMGSRAQTQDFLHWREVSLPTEPSH